MGKYKYGGDLAWPRENALLHLNVQFFLSKSQTQLHKILKAESSLFMAISCTHAHFLPIQLSSSK